MILQNNRHRKLFVIILAAAFLFKSAIFVFGLIHAPESMFDSDSQFYLQTAETIRDRGVFGIENPKDKINYNAFKTPGYPVFLALTHDTLKLPLAGVVFLQLLLNMLTGIIVYKLAVEIDYRIGLLSMAIAVFDPPTTVFSLKVMSEALYILFLFAFVYLFIRYIKSGRTGFLACSALLLVLATFVRPISYFLGIAVAVFVLYANPSGSLWKSMAQAIVFLFITYSILGAWQVRNYQRTGSSSFAGVGDSNFRVHGLVSNSDKSSNKFLQAINYLDMAWVSLIDLMTPPGTLKYYKSKFLAALGKIFFYPWMVFWMAGLLVGCVKARRNIYCQFLFLLMLYFIGVTIVNISDAGGERFRIPFVASIAVISSFGWLAIRDFWARNKWVTAARRVK